jgi:hypothetical protein
LTLNQAGFEKEGLDSMSYKELGQHLVTDQGMRSRPVEVLEGRFKAILLLAGANNPALLRQSQGTLGQGDQGRQSSFKVDGIKAMGDDKGDEVGAGFHSWDMPGGASARIGGIDGLLSGI